MFHSTPGVPYELFSIFLLQILVPSFEAEFLCKNISQELAWTTLSGTCLYPSKDLRLVRFSIIHLSRRISVIVSIDAGADAGADADADADADTDTDAA